MSTEPAYSSIGPDGRLVFDGCDAVQLAMEYGTPLYVMSETAIRERLTTVRLEFLDRHPGTCAVFASKAFQTLEMCRIVASEGLGVDVVSGGELFAAAKAGVDPALVFFHGNSKTQSEIRMAVEFGVGRVVVDSMYELEALNEAAQKAGKRVAILFRITPGVDNHTHRFISTGQLDSKFGIPLDPRAFGGYIEAALSMPGIDLAGFHFHVGSQILENDSHVKATGIALSLMRLVKEKYGLETRDLNLGGGYGVRYTAQDDPKGLAYFTDAMMAEIKARCAEYSLAFPRVIIEPGRWIVGEAGMTLYTVGSVKEIPDVRTYVGVDGGLPDNPRPMLYDARYEATVANRHSSPRTRMVTVVGKCCETGDVLIRDISLQDPAPGDILAVFSTGAYNYTMASNYNRIPRPALVMVSAGEHRLSVRRETYEDLVAREL
jgi:diaminopimelate decarboxylase